MDKIKNGRANRTNNKNRKIKIEKNYYDEEQNANVYERLTKHTNGIFETFLRIIHSLSMLLLVLPTAY